MKGEGYEGRCEEKVLSERSTKGEGYEGGVVRKRVLRKEKKY